jgi:hypothetical protein
MYFPGNWRLWARWEYRTCRIVLPLRQYVNFAVAEHSFLTADKLKVSKCNTIITQSRFETKEYYFTWQLTTLCSDCFTRSQAAWHLPLFQSAVSWGPRKLFQCITVTSGFKSCLNCSPLVHRHVPHPTTTVFIANRTNVLWCNKTVSNTLQWLILHNIIEHLVVIVYKRKENTE